MQWGSGAFGLVFGCFMVALRMHNDSVSGALVGFFELVELWNLWEVGSR